MMNKMLFMNKIVEELTRQLENGNIGFFRVNDITFPQEDRPYDALIKLAQDKDYPNRNSDVYVEFDGEVIEFYDNNYVKMFQKEVAA